MYRSAYVVAVVIVPRISCVGATGRLERMGKKNAAKARSKKKFDSSEIRTHAGDPNRFLAVNPEEGGNIVSK